MKFGQQQQTYYSYLDSTAIAATTTSIASTASFIRKFDIISVRTPICVCVFSL